MPATPLDGATVSAVQGDDGDVTIGVTIDGKFVPVATAAAGRVAQFTSEGPDYYNAPEPEKKAKA